jgi:hypothetical protein
MILEEKVKDLVVVGEDTSKKAKISGDKLQKLQYLLTKGLYKDPITAVIAEWTNNGIDSVVQAGKNPVENPVIVTIGQTLDSKGQIMFRVEDKGVGLDDRDFEDICMNYLESTKESDNDTIGHFGIGMKSFLSLERPATFTCRKAGKERKYLVYEGAEFVNFDLIHQKDTTEEDGVIAELKIKDWSERQVFTQKARAKLAYYDTVALIINGVAETNEIYRNELFQWSTQNTDTQMHICLKDVYYQIDWSALGIKPIELPIAIRLGLESGIKPTPSRESYITNDSTKALLLDKIKEVANWFVRKYNETVSKPKSFIEAYCDIGLFDKTVELEGEEFFINHIASHGTVKILPMSVEDIKLQDAHFYKTQASELLRAYTVVGYTNDRGVIRTKQGRIGISKERHILQDAGVTVLVEDNFRGNIRDYLKDKYGIGTMFVKNNGFVRRLGKSKEYGANGQMKIDVETYRHVLNLSIKKKATWRPLIEEWNLVVSNIVRTFKDETKVEDDPKFHVWLEEKREAQREERKLKGGKAYHGLGKQLGDVTMAYAYERYRKVYFKKAVYPIADLTKNKFLTILLTEDDDVELARGIAYSMGVDKPVKFALVGKKEIKKIPDHFQFINFQKFMTRDCKPFMRLASAIKFESLIAEYDHMTQYKNDVFKKIFATFKNNVDALRTYCNANITHGMGLSLKNTIIDAADAHDLYDKSLWAEYLYVKEALRRYDFINLLAVPYVTNHELTARYEKLVNQILLFRKKFYNDLPEGAKIVFEEVKTQANEVV